MVKRLKSNASYPLPNNVKQLLEKYEYVFNPSFLIHNEISYMAVRVYDEQSSSILALILVWDKNSEVEQINLSIYFKTNLNLSKVADPKLFIMNDKVFGSFNNSHAMNEPNKLVLFELDRNRIKDYSVCNYEERTRTEKNWNFFIEKNQLFALYSLNPLTILKADVADNHSILFRKSYIDKRQSYNNYSIGTPLIKLKEGYGFIAHKKYFRKRKLLYLGKPCIFLNKEKPEIKISKQIVIHSFKSLFGNKFKFNKNLISCTYFSGIHNLNGNLVISYGINDIDWNIAVIKPEKIWH